MLKMREQTASEEHSSHRRLNVAAALNEESVLPPATEHPTSFVDSAAVENLPRRNRIPLYRSDLFGVGGGIRKLRTLREQRRTQRTHRNIQWTRPRKRAVVMLALATAVGMRWHFANASPVVLTPPDPRTSLTAPNAAHFYAIAADSLDMNVVGKIDPDQTALAEKRLMVSRAQPALNRLREGFAYEYHGQRTNWLHQAAPLNLETPTPNFVLQRTIARLLASEATVYSADGKKAAALSSAMDAMRFGQDVGQEPSLIGGMIGLLCEGIGSAEAVKQVDSLTAAEARAAMPRFQVMLQNERPFSDIIRDEQYFINGAMQQIFSGSIAQHFDLNALDNNLWSRLHRGGLYTTSVLYYGKQGIMDKTNARFHEIIRRADQPFQVARKLSNDTLPALPYLVNDWMPTSFHKAHLSHTRIAARKRVLLAQLAVQAYRGEHSGNAPRSLQDLTVGSAPYLTTVPNDPFSGDAQQPLRYRDGRVYSVGENGQDDSGLGDDTLKQYP
jgi:hypothetical protein